MTADVPDPRSTDPVLRDDRLLDAVGRGDPAPVDHPADDPVAHLLVGWHAELGTRERGLHRASADPVLPDDVLSDGVGDLPPLRRFSDDQISGAVAHRRDRPVGTAPGQRPPAVRPAKPIAPHRRRLAALAGATVAMVATAGGLWVSAAGAEPGSPLWPVTELLCADWAESRLAEQEASHALDEGRRAVAEGRYADARHHLDRAAGLLTTAGRGANVPRLRAEADALRRLLPEPATSAATPFTASIEAEDPASADAMPTEPPSATASVEPQAPAPLAAEPTIAGNDSSGTATATSAKPATATATRSRRPPVHKSDGREPDGREPDGREPDEHKRDGQQVAEPSGPRPHRSAGRYGGSSPSTGQPARSPGAPARR